MLAERGHGDGFHTVRELTVDAAAGDADEGPEAGAHVLRPESVAVDTSAVGRQLEQPPHDPLVPLLLLPRRGRHCPPPRTCRAASGEDGEGPGSSPESRRGGFRERRADDAGIGSSSGSEAWVVWRSACLRSAATPAGVCLRLVSCVAFRSSWTGMQMQGPRRGQGGQRDPCRTLVAATA